MKKIFLIAGTIVAGLVLVYSFIPVPSVQFSGALSVFQVNQGGTGTSSPSGILYGDNSGSNPLKTVIIGSNLTFAGGTLSSSGGGAWPFVASTTFGTSTQSTSTPIWDRFGLYASSTSHIDYASTTAVSAGSLFASSLYSTGNLLLTGAGGTVSFTGTGATTMFFDGTELYAGNGNVNLGVAGTNPWGSLYVNYASTTVLSVFSKAYFGGSATTTIDSAGNIVIPSGSNLTITGKSDGCATFATGVLNSTGSACGSGSGGAWPFTASTTFGTSTQATTTPIWDLFGIYASSTSQIAYATSTAVTVWTKLYTPQISGLAGDLSFFAPSGTDVFSASGPNSMIFDGTTLYASDNTSDLGSLANRWRMLNVFHASTTELSVFKLLYVGGTATTSIDSAGNLLIPAGGSIAQNGVSDGCATWSSGVINSTGVACGSGSGSAWPFTSMTRMGTTTQGTTTPLYDQSGFIASSTSQFVNENIWGNLTIEATTSAILATDASGNVIASTTIGSNYISGVLGTVNTSAPLGGGGAFSRGTTLTLTCTTCVTGWPFTASTTFGTSTQATTTPIWDQFGLYASSTSHFVNLNVWNQLTLKATSSALLGTDSSGNVVATTSIGTNYLTGTLLTVTTAAPLGGAATISQGQTLALTCATCATTSFWPFSAMTRMGTTTQGTTTPIYDQSGFIASSTNQFVNENIWGNLTIESTTSAILATDASGNVIASTTIGSNYISGVLGTINTSAPLGGGGAFSRGTTLTLTCTTCITAAQWPFSAITTFGTTTQGTTTPMSDQSGYFASSTSNFVGLNIWGNLNLEATTSALLGTDSLGNVVATTSVGANYLTGVLGVSHGGTGQSTFTASQLIYGNLTAGLSSVGTSTLTASSPLTGSFIQIGSGGSLGCQTASGSQAGCISSTDWNTFNAKWGGAITTNFGTSTIASTTPAWFQMGLYASSTSQFVNLNIWNQLTLKATSSALLGTDSSGNVVATTSIGVNLLAASGVSGSSCTNCNLSYTAAGIITSAANGSAGSGSWPFSAITTFGTTTQGTTTPMSDQSGYYASSTSNFVGLNIWGNLNLKATSSAVLGTDSLGNVVATSSIGANYITGAIFTVTTASPLGGAATINRGDTLALTCATCNTSSLAGSGVTGMMTAWSGANTLSATGTVMGGWMIATNTNATSTFNGNVVVASTSANTFKVNDGFGTNILNVNTSSTTSGYNLLDLRSSTSTGTLFGVDQFGHVFASSTTPVLSTCGTSPSITTDSSDFSGTITVGSVAATGCTLTFGTLHVNAPHCVITNQSMSVVNAMTYTEGTTGFTVSMTGLTGDKLDYICTGK